MKSNNHSRRSLLGCLMGGIFGLFAVEKAAQAAIPNNPTPSFLPPVDPAGSAFVAGSTPSFSLQAEGSSLVWSTYIGGAGFASGGHPHS